MQLCAHNEGETVIVIIYYVNMHLAIIHIHTLN